MIFDSDCGGEVINQQVATWLRDRDLEESHDDAIHHIPGLDPGPLAGCHGARRGTYRILYRIDETSRVVHVLDIDHRSEIYGRRHR
ncbi:type II toxin-antitoxin system RelE family toxin [Mycobacterium sp.]|uniref:type II toxin-antitoxin system RelE family toxin n=1 Tax=Mycobacterium sp. TaxID=1785 RepID=UPI003A8A2FC0